MYDRGRKSALSNFARFLLSILSVFIFPSAIILVLLGCDNTISIPRSSRKSHTGYQFIRCWAGDIRHPPIRVRSPLCRVVNGAANQPLGLSRPWGLMAYPLTQQSTNMCFREVYFSWHQTRAMLKLAR